MIIDPTHIALGTMTPYRVIVGIAGFGVAALGAGTMDVNNLPA